MTQPAAIVPSSGWTVEGFKTFWAAPVLSFVPKIRQMMAGDIIGHWPRPIGDIRDPDLYLGVIADILTICPDWKLEVPEHAQSGDLYFVRWTATGTDADGRFKFEGCDRIKVDGNGLVLENFIFCDHPFFSRIDPRRGAEVCKSLPPAA